MEQGTEDMITLHLKFLLKNNLILLMFTWIILISIQSPLFAADTPKEKNVLILFPYQNDLPQTVLATDAIRNELRNVEDLNIKLYVECMDINRFADNSYRKQLVSLYTYKYAQKPIDLVMVTSLAALEFWMAHRDRILPKIPTVFYDIKSENINDRAFPSDVTGVGSEGIYDKSFSWIKETLPDVDEIILVYGVGEADRAFREGINSLKNNHTEQIKLTDWSQLPLSEIKERAANLPPNTVIFYYLMLEDAAGVKYRPIDALREIARVSAVPVISCYDQFIGTGTIGGYLYSIEKYAVIASHIGLRILRGEAVRTINISTASGNLFIFDHPALQRYNIPLSNLPPGSIVKNRQYSVWENHRQQITGVIIGFSILILLIVILISLNLRLKVTRRDLSQLNASLETQVKQRTAELTQINCNLKAEIEERIQAETEREKVIADLQKALTTINKLEAFLPICSFCKKVRDENNQWHNVETYISNCSQVQFSHSYCPECAQKHYPKYATKRKDE